MHNTDELRELICGAVPPEMVKTDEPMSEHTSFRVGGPADVFVTPDRDTLSPLIDILRANNIEFTVIGNGSNLLVSDNGFRGVVISISSGFDNISADTGNCILTAGGGALLSSVYRYTRTLSLAGLEFASGIPGSVGGAVMMNAGAYGSEIKDVLQSAEVFRDGSFLTLTLEELDLSYRYSSLKPGDIVTEAVFKLEAGDQKEITEKAEELNRRRREKQPLNFPSAGSTFKRPEGYFAGKLIQDAGLKGYTIGGAQVSEKHSGFIINTGSATASDIYALIGHVQKEVSEKFGVELKREVRLLGEF